MPGFVFVADANDVSRDQCFLKVNKGLAGITGNMTDTEPGAGRAIDRDGILRPLGKKRIMGSGTSQCKRQEMQGFFSNM